MCASMHLIGETVRYLTTLVLPDKSDHNQLKDFFMINLLRENEEIAY